MAQSESPFHDGDRVVFVGDSVTQQRLYTTYIECFLLTHFPKWRLTFRNAGVGSDAAWMDQRAAGTDMSTPALQKLQGKEQEEMLVRMVTHGLQRDVLPLKPTVVTVMYGANDARYEATPRLHIRALEEIIAQLRKAKVRVVLLSASPEEPFDGDWNKRHEQYIAAVRGFAEREKVLYVDQFHPVLQAVLDARKVDPGFGYTRDSVHPHPQGHLLMARAILQGLGLDASKLSAETTPLMAKVIEKNDAYFRRWREIQIPAMLANKLDDADVKAKLAEADKHIAELESEIELLRKPKTSKAY